MTRDFRQFVVRVAIVALTACKGESPSTIPDTGSLPAAPTDLTASNGPGYNTITLRWDSVAGARSYNLYWGTTAGVTPQNGSKFADLTTTATYHPGLTSGTTYEYVVTAVNDRGEGAPSAPARATVSDIYADPCMPLGGLVGSQLEIVVRAISRFVVAGVTARVNDRAMNLVAGTYYGFCPGSGTSTPAWLGTLSLADLPRGPITLTISATDVMGNVANTFIPLVLDDPPTVSITAPDEFVVARPSLHVTATCQDDDPQGCALAVYANGAGPALATGKSRIDDDVSLASHDGELLQLVVKGTDSREQVATDSRHVLVESSNQLTEVASVDGFIWDVQPDRILFSDLPIGGNALSIHDRTARTDAVIFNAARVVLRYESGFLTPTGAMFVVDSGDTNRLYDWENGGLSNFGSVSSRSSLVVKGHYAIWSVAQTTCCAVTLMLRDFNTGQNRVVSSAAAASDLAPNGDVVYEAGAQIFRFRNGSSTQLTSDPTVLYSSPRTDGIVVAYTWYNPSTRKVGTATHDASGEHVLTANSHPFDQSYQVANGWAAYRKDNDGNLTSTYWSRSPAGQELQVTHFATPTFLKAVGPNGEVVLTNAFGSTTRRYVAVPDYSAAPREIGSDIGSAFFLNGTLFVSIGRSVFQVNP